MEATSVGTITHASCTFTRGEMTVTVNGSGTFDGGVQDGALGTSFFSSGLASFHGLTWTLNPGESRHVFLIGAQQLRLLAKLALACVRSGQTPKACSASSSTRSPDKDLVTLPRN